MPDINQLAGAQQPEQAQPQQDPFGGQPAISPDTITQEDVQKILQVLESLIPQATDENGYLDMTKLAGAWTQAAVEAGLNLPFQILLQILEEVPELVQDLIVKMGLAGIILEGQVISGEQLGQMGGGAANPVAGAQPQQPPQGGVA